MYRLFVDNLTNIDFTYFDSSRGLVGETLLASIELIGDLNPDKMLLDFAEVKRYLKHEIEDLFDHKFVVPTQGSGISVNSNNDQVHITLLDDQQREYQHISPPAGVYLAPAAEISIATLTELLNEHIQLPQTELECLVHLKPEHISGAYYHYSHGLRQHDGACQRIAHGHRSQLHIFVNNDRNSELESQWSAQWEDIYLGCEADIKQTYQKAGVDYHYFEYQASEGQYELQIPSDRVDILPNSSTVECIAQYIATQLKARSSTTDTTRVKAFEGINKGAIFEV